MRCSRMSVTARHVSWAGFSQRSSPPTIYDGLRRPPGAVLLDFVDHAWEPEAATPSVTANTLRTQIDEPYNLLVPLV
jgi:hypothetical protein